jgi:hypothetical protein
VLYGSGLLKRMIKIDVIDVGRALKNNLLLLPYKSITRQNKESKVRII